MRPFVVVLAVVAAGGPPPAAPAGATRPATPPVAATSAAIEALPKPIAVVPFDLYDGRAFLKVYVDGKGPGQLQFDSAAGTSCVSRRFGERIHLKTPFVASASGAGDGQQMVPLATDCTFAIGPLSFRTERVPLIDFDGLDLGLGRRTDGLVGRSFLDRYVVAFDYAARTMTAYEPAGFEYRGEGAVLSLELAAGGPTVPAVVRMPDRAPLPVKLLLDAPHAGPLLLTSPFVDQHDLLAAARRLTPNLVPTTLMGVGGESAQLLGRALSLEIGPYGFQSPVVLLSRATAGTLASKEVDGLIGSQVLARFRVIFDFPHHRVVLEPGPRLSDPFPHDMSGLRLRAQTLALTTIEVADVIAGSPVAEAGVERGDLLLAVNDRPAWASQLPDLRHLFGRSGTPRLKLRHGGERKAVVLQLRPLV